MMFHYIHAAAASHRLRDEQKDDAGRIEFMRKLQDPTDLLQDASNVSGSNLSGR